VKGSAKKDCRNGKDPTLESEKKHPDRKEAPGGVKMGLIKGERREGGT